MLAKGIHRPYPVPKTKSRVLKAQDLDSEVVDLLSERDQRSVKNEDHSLRRVQEKLIKVFGPLGKLWSRVEDSVLNKSKLPDPDKILDYIEKSIILLGHAHTVATFDRRLAILTRVCRNPGKAREFLSHNKDMLRKSRKRLFGHKFYEYLYQKAKGTKRGREIKSQLWSQVARGSKTRGNRRFPSSLQQGRSFQAGGYQQSRFGYGQGRGTGRPSTPARGGKGTPRGGYVSTSCFYGCIKCKRFSRESRESQNGIKCTHGRYSYRKGARLMRHSSFLQGIRTGKSRARCSRHPSCFAGIKSVSDLRGGASLHRSLALLSGELESSDKLPRGIEHGSGSADRLDKSAIPVKYASSSGVFLKGTVSHSKRVGQPAEKRGCDPSRLVRGTVPQPYFLGSKKRRYFLFSVQSQKAQCVHEHFKMESTPMLMNLNQRGDWMCTIDLKDAYFSMPISLGDRKYLRFVWQGQLYQFQVLPFGLSAAPRAFTKLLRPVIGLLRRLGFRLLIYLDDIILLNQLKGQLEQERDSTLWLLQRLGFIINWDKSVLSPSQQVVYLGFQIDSTKMTLALPQQKITAIQDECLSLLRSDVVSVRQLARLIGKLTASVLAILPAPLHFRQLQMAQSKALLSGHQSYETILPLTPECKGELCWWLQSLEACNGRNIITPTADLVITTDSSSLGWGAECQGLTTQGRWSQTKSQQHVNVLELQAIDFAVRAFARNRTYSHIHIRTDNTTALAQISKMGGTRSARLLQVCQGLWNFCLESSNILTAGHIPGAENAIADFQSRQFQDRSDWRLLTEIFQQISRSLGPVEVDLFSNRLNAQLEKYVSWKPDPFALATDAFLLNWKGLKGYAFPPFCLIGTFFRFYHRQVDGDPFQDKVLQR